MSEPSEDQPADAPRGGKSKSVNPYLYVRVPYGLLAAINAAARLKRHKREEVKRGAVPGPAASAPPGAEGLRDGVGLRDFDVRVLATLTSLKVGGSPARRASIAVLCGKTGASERSVETALRRLAGGHPEAPNGFIRDLGFDEENSTAPESQIPRLFVLLFVPGGEDYLASKTPQPTAPEK